MKKIGKQVFFLPTSEQVKRNGEGAFIRLKDGRIMFGYTQYGSCGNGRRASAGIALFMTII